MISGCVIWRFDAEGRLSETLAGEFLLRFLCVSDLYGVFGSSMRKRHVFLAIDTYFSESSH